MNQIEDTDSTKPDALNITSDECQLSSAGSVDGSSRPVECADPAGFRLTQAQHEALFTNSVSGILVTTSDGLILTANPAACRLLRRTEQQLRELTRGDIVMRDDPLLKTLAADCERTGRCHGELTLVRGDGSTFEAEVASVTIDEPDRTMITMIIADVTPRKQMETRIREQAQWLDRANDGVFVSDNTLRITYWNSGAERITGWSTADVVGRTIDELLTMAGIGAPEVLRAAHEDTDWRGTVSCRRRQGSQLVVGTSCTMLRCPGGGPAGRLCIFTDVTEHTQLREKYERAQRLQSIGLIAAGVAHDFNNLLTPIAIGVPVLKEHVSDASARQLLDTIQNCVHRGAAVSKHMLELARGIGGDATVTHVASILGDLTDLVRETFPRSIALRTDFAREPWPVMANPTQIHRMLLNLCINARDAMPGGGTLRLSSANCLMDEDGAARIDGARKGAWLVLSVEDSGKGIASEILPEVWKPFFTTKSNGMGTGLGLSTVKEIVETHAGFITVDSRPNHGTVFRAYLPAIASAVVKSPRNSAPPFASGHGEKVLVIDDEPAVLQAARDALVRSGYQVVTAASSLEAIRLLKTRRGDFQLMLTDVDLPDLDGLRLARIAATLHPDLKVMAMTGLATQGSVRHGSLFNAGMLAKPFTVDVLLRSVRNAIDRTL